MGIRHSTIGLPYGSATIWSLTLLGNKMNIENKSPYLARDDLKGGQQVYERVMRYAGKLRKDVSGPQFTANEMIALASFLSTIVDVKSIPSGQV